MIEQAHRVFMQAAYCVGYHREKGNVKGFVGGGLYGRVCLR